MTRRGFLSLGAALVSASCARPKTAGYAGHALIATSGENALAIVDLSSFQLRKSIPLKAPPSAVVAGKVGGESYIVTPAIDTVHVVDPNLAVISSHRLGEGLAQVRLSSDTETLIAIARRSRELIFAESKSLSIRKRVKLAAEPDSFDLARSGVVAISTGAKGWVEMFDPASGAQGRIDIGSPVGDIRFRGDGQILLAACPAGRRIVAIDVATRTQMAELPLAMQPDQLCFNSDQGQLFVSGRGMDAVAIVFPYNVMEVEQTVLAGRDPGVMTASGVTASGEPPYLFVASASGSDVSILNVATRKLIGVVDVGGQPRFMTVTPDNRFALVLNESSGDLAVIHIPGIHANRAKTGAALFRVVAVGAKPVHAAIVPSSN